MVLAQQGISAGLCLDTAREGIPETGMIPVSQKDWELDGAENGSKSFDHIR